MHLLLDRFFLVLWGAFICLYFGNAKQTQLCVVCVFKQLSSSVCRFLLHKCIALWLLYCSRLLTSLKIEGTPCIARSGTKLWHCSLYLNYVSPIVALISHRNLLLAFQLIFLCIRLLCFTVQSAPQHFCPARLTSSFLNVSSCELRCPQPPWNQSHFVGTCKHSLLGLVLALMVVSCKPCRFAKSGSRWTNHQ